MRGAQQTVESARDAFEGADPEPPRRPIDVEVALPTEWHREPMALDPYGPLGVD